MVEWFEAKDGELDTWPGGPWEAGDWAGLPVFILLALLLFLLLPPLPKPWRLYKSSCVSIRDSELGGAGE